MGIFARNFSPETSPTLASMRMNITRTQVLIPPPKPTTALDDGTMKFGEEEAPLTGAEKAPEENMAREEVNIPFCFGYGLPFDFTFSVPASIIADQPHNNQEQSGISHVQDVPINQDLSMADISQSLGTVSIAVSMLDYPSSPDDVGSDVSMPDYPQSLGTLQTLLGSILRGISKDEENKDSPFLKRPVSKAPQNRLSLLTEQLRAQEAEEEADITDAYYADDQYRSAAELDANVMRALARMNTGNSAVSQTPAPSRRCLETTQPSVEELTTTTTTSRPPPGLVYLPYGLMARFRMRDAVKALARGDPRFTNGGSSSPLRNRLDDMEMARREFGRAVPIVEIICCNCVGLNFEGEFHCSMCRSHALCKECDVGISGESMEWMEARGFI